MYPFEVVDRGSETQFQVCGNLNYLIVPFKDYTCKVDEEHNMLEAICVP